MLSFELAPAEIPEELLIIGDRAGLTSLLAQLTLVLSGKTDHVHLMAPSWGGTHLSDGASEPGNVPVRQVKVVLTADDFVR